MRVLAISYSPKMDKGITALSLNPFLEGMREAGADVEPVHAKKLDIGPCLGRLECFIQGACILKDHRQTLLPKLQDADVWVFATPIY